MVSEAQTAGWTEERVELLKKLWMEGLSASQIAGELGQGVTRNAVIGKVHRLKLSARAKPTNTAPRARPAAPRPAAPRRVTGTSSGLSSAASAAAKVRHTMPRPQTMGATALAVAPEMEAELYVAPAAELFIPEEKRLSLLQLNEHTCKWPIGDPLTPDFYFCGQHSLETGPYCDFHSRRAYHQIDRRKR
jgi:GcrA cell cycle regulator